MYLTISFSFFLIFNLQLVCVWYNCRYSRNHTNIKSMSENW